MTDETQPVNPSTPRSEGYRPGTPPPLPPAQPQVVVTSPRTGFFAFVGKLFGALTLIFVLMSLGFYAGLGTALSGGGHVGVSVYEEGKGKEKIAIVPVSGMIDGSTATFARHVVDAILKDDDVKAVVLRIESPGGGATASDEILREFQRLKQRNIPVLASYGDYAASGGYYVSCHADVIFAQPTSITGSIGVIAPFVTIEGLLKDKLGITPEVVTSTAATDKDTASFMRSWTEKDRAAVRELLDGIQKQFISIVAAGRKGKMTEEDVVKVATGRAMMAEEALAKKLIDRIGYLDEALAEARSRANLPENSKVIQYYRHVGFFDVEMTGAVSGTQWKEGGLRIDAATLRRLVLELSVPTRMMLMQ